MSDDSRERGNGDVVLQGRLFFWGEGGFAASQAPADSEPVSPRSTKESARCSLGYQTIPNCLEEPCCSWDPGSHLFQFHAVSMNKYALVHPLELFKIVNQEVQYLILTNINVVVIQLI